MKKIPIKYKYIFILNCAFPFLLLITSCTPLRKAIKNYPSDNFVEEIVEDVIESRTGLDLDLTPFSPEN